jgi:DNA-binding response OmpR family regulator
MAKKVLIIDDDPDVVLALRMPLESSGYQVQDAHSQETGLAAVDSFKPDVIILDVMMETHTAGFQLAQKLHGPSAKEEYLRTPILMLTAVHQTTPLRFGPDEDYLPVDDFIEKPVDPKVLMAKIEKVLKK